MKKNDALAKSNNNLHDHIVEREKTKYTTPTISSYSILVNLLDMINQYVLNVRKTNI